MKKSISRIKIDDIQQDVPLDIQSIPKYRKMKWLLI